MTKAEKVKRLKELKKSLKNSELDFIRKDLIIKGNLSLNPRLMIYNKHSFFTGSAINTVHEYAKRLAIDNWWMDTDAHNRLYISIQ
jgi:hypothetical protein